MKKNHEIRVKMSREEHQTVRAKALKLGLSVSAFLRLLGLNADITTTNLP